MANEPKPEPVKSEKDLDKPEPVKPSKLSRIKHEAKVFGAVALPTAVVSGLVFISWKTSLIEFETAQINLETAKLNQLADAVTTKS